MSFKALAQIRIVIATKRSSMMHIKFDPDKAPDAVRQVVVVKGSLYEMGFQYGQQAWEQIERNAAILKGEIIPKWEAGRK